LRSTAEEENLETWPTLGSLVELMESFAEELRSRFTAVAWRRFISSLMLCFSAPGAKTSFARVQACIISLGFETVCHRSRFATVRCGSGFELLHGVV
jgi:hypothetical protein